MDLTKRPKLLFKDLEDWFIRDMFIEIDSVGDYGFASCIFEKILNNADGSGLKNIDISPKVIMRLLNNLSKLLHCEKVVLKHALIKIVRKNNPLHCKIGILTEGIKKSYSSSLSRWIEWKAKEEKKVFSNIAGFDSIKKIIKIDCSCDV